MNQIDKAIIAIEACLEIDKEAVIKYSVLKNIGVNTTYLLGRIEAYESALRILNKYKVKD